MPSSHRLILTAEAEDDLAGIWQYVAEQWGESQAESYTDGISNKLTHLTWFPELGWERSEIAPELRSLVIGQHVAFYRRHEQDVIVRRIFHTRQDQDFEETLIPE